MALEEEPQFLIDEIREGLIAQEPHYKAGVATELQMSGQEFVGVTGPFRIGKSVSVDEAVRLDPRVHLINTTTTRRRKPEDPTGFRTADEGVTFTSFRDAVNNHDLVNFSVIPGADAYGTYPDGFTGEFNIGPFLPSSIDQLLAAGLRDEAFVYLVAPGEIWRGFVEESRHTLPPLVFKKRAFESIDSTKFAQDNMHRFHFVENSESGGMTKVAEKILDITFHRPHDALPLDRAAALLAEMQAVAEDLAVYG